MPDPARSNGNGKDFESKVPEGSEVGVSIPVSNGEHGLQETGVGEEKSRTGDSRSPRMSTDQRPSLAQLSFSIGGPVLIPDRDTTPPDDEDGLQVLSTSQRVSGVGDSFILDVAGNNSKRDRPVPIAVKFEQVEYKVVIKPPAAFWWDPKGMMKSLKRVGHKGTEKKILHGITGSVLPGEVLAMMGPSGSGKTTLLNVLGGRVTEGITGKVLYDDLPYSKSLKRRMGFVTQDDVLFAHLTVRETLMFAALLRLPKEMSRAQKLQRTDDTITELGLERCKNTIIGGPFMRGISGGERKRVSIGHEILIDPSFILLDEPTSGLDSTTALRIMQVLQQLAQGGRTVITTIHQPSSRVFKMFDKLILLAEGNTMFFGPAKNAMKYFENVGFAPMFATNPADFLLDLATGTSADISIPEELQGAAADGKVTPKTGGTLQKEVREYLINAYRTKEAGKEIDRVHALPMADDASQAKLKNKREWSTSWIEQFNVLFVRGLKERRHELLSWLRFAQVIAISIIVGCLWFNSKINTESHIQDQVGMLFFVAIFWGFFPLFTAIFTFPQERSVLAKERASDMYRLSAYFMARTLGDMPMELILPTIFMIIAYWMAHLNQNFGVFLLTMLSVYLNVVVAQGLGLMIGAAVMDVKKATTIASVVLLTFMLAGGYYLQKIPVFITWVKYLSINWYMYRLIVKIQYDASQTYFCGEKSTTGNGQCSIRQAPAIRTDLDNPGMEVWPLLIMMVGYRLLAYIALRRMKTGV